jgi:hypothetical protein
MTGFHVASLGAFMQAAAHYVHAGPTGYYLLWCVVGGFFAGFSAWRDT